VPITIDSALRRPPITLNPKQAQFLDGVRVAIEMIDIAYQSLAMQLKALCPIPPVSTARRGIVSAPAFLNAWSIIDNVHRLRGLVDNFPGFAKKRQSAEVRVFLEGAATVEDFRHAVQHMEGAIRESAPQGRGVWGSLSWMYRADEENLLSCVLTLGALMPAAEVGEITPSVLREGVDGIVLKVDKTSVNLTKLVATVDRLADFLQSSIADQFNLAPVDRAESDYFLAIAMKRGPNDTLVIPATEPQKTL
jgi:hypothetical protein